MEVKLTLGELWNGWEQLDPSPTDVGTVDMIVRRPQTEEREEVEQAEFDTKEGLIGDNWLARGSSSTPDGSAHPEAQITLMNSRVIQLIAGDEPRWDLAGDQLFVDFDLSMDNLPAGSRIQIGDVIMEISQKPHTGCDKFARSYGAYARKFVMTDKGKQLRLRGVNAQVIQGGTINKNDKIEKVTS